MAQIAQDQAQGGVVGGYEPEHPPTAIPKFERQCKRFREHNPKSFEGSPDPKDVERWLQGMEKIFRVMRCSDQDKVELASDKLEGSGTFVGRLLQPDGSYPNCNYVGIIQGAVSITPHSSTIKIHTLYYSSHYCHINLESIYTFSFKAVEEIKIDN